MVSIPALQHSLYIIILILLSESKSFSEAKITSLYEKYKDAQDDSILSEGIEEFCIDLQLKPDEFQVLGESCLLSEKCVIFSSEQVWTRLKKKGKKPKSKRASLQIWSGYPSSPFMDEVRLFPRKIL